MTTISAIYRIRVKDSVVRSDAKRANVNVRCVITEGELKGAEFVILLPFGRAAQTTRGQAAWVHALTALGAQFLNTPEVWVSGATLAGKEGFARYGTNVADFVLPSELS